MVSSSNIFTVPKTFLLIKLNIVRLEMRLGCREDSREVSLDVRAQAGAGKCTTPALPLLKGGGQCSKQAGIAFARSMHRRFWRRGGSVRACQQRATRRTTALAKMDDTKFWPAAEGGGSIFLSSSSLQWSHVASSASSSRAKQGFCRSPPQRRRRRCPLRHRRAVPLVCHMRRKGTNPT